MSQTDVQVSVSEAKMRQFSGVIGLEYTVDGCKSYWTHTDVKTLLIQWIRSRMIEGKTNLCACVSNVESLMYCYQGDVVEEPFVRVYGEIVIPNADKTDEEIKNVLIELLTYFKIQLKQDTVRFNFQGYDIALSIRIFN